MKAVEDINNLEKTLKLEEGGKINADLDITFTHPLVEAKSPFVCDFKDSPMLRK